MCMFEESSYVPCVKWFVHWILMQYKWFKLNLRLFYGYQFYCCRMVNKLFKNRRPFPCRVFYFFLSVTWDPRPGGSNFSCRWQKKFLSTLVPTRKIEHRQKNWWTGKKILYYCRPSPIGVSLSVYRQKKLIFHFSIGFCYFPNQQEFLSFQ